MTEKRNKTGIKRTPRGSKNNNNRTMKLNHIFTESLFWNDFFGDVYSTKLKKQHNKLNMIDVSLGNNICQYGFSTCSNRLTTRGQQISTTQWFTLLKVTYSLFYNYGAREKKFNRSRTNLNILRRLKWEISKKKFRSFQDYKFINFQKKSEQNKLWGEKKF